ncbi:hypothetical protein LTS13_002318 [Exophiala xenobiotica]|nr:hypothetical protein LTR92_003252 [Exophiala xenobiotica]KAK5213684.1 hypothetical protein LTR41_001264 [Exophiala xenobiotica]KAK5278850.1 hypothetical protein LTR40_008600 [Exophiala xenobiotica]KAK5384125.1 hypothetical protein LTS13_002318 [Exophiala xenobiotica]KAK5416358.1 hypothetical protein LTR90_005579 [Exophiala xenobiotica]
MIPTPGAATDEATPLMVGEKDSHQVSDWSSSQGFFVVMGGLSVRLRHENSNGVLQDHEYSFTPAGVELLAMADGLPAVTKEDVEERSNADVIAKIIVLCQVTWFALQVLSRLLAKRPVTALETHTTVHVGCAIMMYLFWFNKPYNVSRAILLMDAISREIGALLVFRKLWAESYDDRLRQHEKQSERYWQERVINESQNIMVLDPPPALPVREPLDQAIERYSATISVEGVDSNPQEKVLQTLSKDAKSGWQRLTTRFDNSIVRLVLDKTCLSGIKQTADNFEIRTVWGSWSKDVGHGWSKEKLINMIFNVVYGAAHLTAWNASSFPTYQERWIWRISGLILVAVPVWAGLWIFWWKASTSNNKWLFIFRNGDMDIIGGPFFCVVIVAYTLARCYFLVEALVSLRQLPAGAYRQDVSFNWPYKVFEDDTTITTILIFISTYDAVYSGRSGYQ